MKKALLLFSLVFALGVIAQTQHTPSGSFEIINSTVPEKNDFFSESIAKSNLENYRLKNQRVTLEFKNGFKLELLSAKELFLKGLPVDVNSYAEEFAAGYKLPLFVVMDNGWIGAEVETNSKSRTK